MKIKHFFSLFLAIMLMFYVPVLAAAQESDESVSAGSHSLHAKVPLAGSEKLLDTAQAVVAYELNSDTLLYSWNADQRINPTGMVKLLTALIVIEEGNLDDLVTVYRSTLDTIAWGAVSAGLKAGEQVPMRDLLLCVMVASANDAAAVMAAHIAGSQKEFVVRMNEKARELGCTNSYFTNVHGLKDPEQYSTARDLAIITEAALENETFREMFAMDNFTMEATNLSSSRYFITTNYMMSDEYMNQYFDYRVTGGKPAAATGADRSMICTAEVGNSHYLFVVMSAKAELSEDGMQVLTFGNFVETRKLMNFVFNSYTVRQVLSRDQALYQYAVKNGENDVILHTQEDVYVLLPADYDRNAVNYQNRVDAVLLTAPITAGDKMGVLQITYGGLVLANCDLLAMNPVPAGESVTLTDERKPVSNKDAASKWDAYLSWAVLAAVILAVFVAFIVLLVKGIRSMRIRRMNTVRARKRKRGR